jgi:hypothetical protein
MRYNKCIFGIVDSSSKSHDGTMTKTTLPLLLLALAGCLGGQSGTPTPAIPDPGCAEVGRTPVDEGEVTSALQGIAGTWVGQCGTQAVRIQIPALEGATTSAESISYEWNAYGAEEASPVDCRTAHGVRFPASASLEEDEANFEMTAVHGRYLPTYGEPAEIDRYARAHTELLGTVSVEEGATNAFTHPPDGMGSEISAVSWFGVFSEDDVELHGRLEWFGYNPNAGPPMPVPDDGSPDGTDPLNPGPDPAHSEQATLVSSCEFTLLRE